jgi:hypothetical protein
LTRIVQMAFADLPEDLQVEIVSYLSLPTIFQCVVSFKPPQASDFILSEQFCTIIFHHSDFSH